MELLLIRHALPVRLERADGSPADPPLSAAGRAQAERLAEWLAAEPLDVLYTSPLRRARETAAPVARQRGLEPRVEPGVSEFDSDAPVYIPMEELKAQDYERWLALVRSGVYVDGDVASFRDTVVASLEKLIETHPGGRVAVICHGGVINAWTSHLLGLEQLFLFDPTYCSVSRFLAARSGERTIGSLNEAAHLRDL
jgi:probable phosphoglycerate mutase